MTGRIVGSFLQNSALLLSMVLVFDLATSTRRPAGKLFGRILAGSLLGCIGVGIMLTAFTVEPGIVIDTRSVLLSVTGFFFGGIQTAVVMLVTAAFRLYLGGSGATTGVAVILATGLVGMAWRRYRIDSIPRMSFQEFFVFGVVVHVVMLAMMITLPRESSSRVVQAIWFPVLLVYPAVTAVLGRILVNRIRREKAEEILAESEARYRSLFEDNRTVVLVVDPLEGAIVEANASACRFYGHSRAMLATMRLWDIEAGDTTEGSAGFASPVDSGESVPARHRAADGSFRDVEIMSGPITLSGRPLRYLMVHDITERKRTQEELNRALSVLAIAGRTARFGGWSVDLVDRRVYWSGHVAAIHEVSPDYSPTLEEGLGFYAQESRARIAEVFEACERHGVPYDEELEIVTAKGNRVCVRTIGEAVRDAPGRIVRVQGSFQDISDRKRVEVFLRERERFLTDVIEHSGMAICVNDREGRYELVNRKWEEENGIDRQDALGKTGASLFRGPVDRGFRESDLAVLESGRTIEIEETVETPSGRRHLLSIEFPVRGKSGVVRAVCRMSTDITEYKRMSAAAQEAVSKLKASRAALLSVVEDRKAAEDRMREAYVYLDNLFKHANAPMAVWDADRCITRFNRAFETISGLDASDVVGRPVHTLFMEPAFGSTSGYSRFVEGTLADSVEIRIRHADGSERAVLWGSASIMAADGKTRIAVIAQGHDITERKRLEVERDSMESRLIQMQKLEAIGTLAAGIAHEINNPIMGIMNYAQLISDSSPPGGSTAEYSGEILRETDRIAGIVRNLLRFSRSERQGHSSARMADIVEHTLSLVRSILRHDRITVEVEVPGELPAIRCRSQQIQQVLMNLLFNARDAVNDAHANDDGKIIRIVCSPLDCDGSPWLRLMVEDNGRGISESIRSRVFDPFFTTKSRDKGTGLGLSISHSIARDHEGVLSFETVEGAYTRFYLDLPVDDRRAPES